jgi:hypothetical protein
MTHLDLPVRHAPVVSVPEVGEADADVLGVCADDGEGSPDL